MLEVRTQWRVIYPQDTGRIQLIGGHRGVRKMSGERERRKRQTERERSRKAVVLVIL